MALLLLAVCCAMTTMSFGLPQQSQLQRLRADGLLGTAGSDCGASLLDECLPPEPNPAPIVNNPDCQLPVVADSSTCPADIRSALQPAGLPDDPYSKQHSFSYKGVCYYSFEPTPRGSPEKTSYSYADAEKICVQAGLQLASIRCQTQMDAIYVNLIHVAGAGNHHRYWLGGTYASSTQQITWLDGPPTTGTVGLFPPWAGAGTEPSLDGGCVQFASNTDDAKGWFTVPCTDKYAGPNDNINFGFVCEGPVGCAAGWSPFTEDGQLHCFKAFLTDGKKAGNAEQFDAMCKGFGATSVSVNSKEENDFVKDLINGEGCSNNCEVYLGYRQEHVTSEALVAYGEISKQYWLDTSSTPFDSSTFGYAQGTSRVFATSNQLLPWKGAVTPYNPSTPFACNGGIGPQPDNIDPEANCATMDPAGEWSDQNCNHLFPGTVCEYVPKADNIVCPNA